MGKKSDLRSGGGGGGGGSGGRKIFFLISPEETVKLVRSVFNL